MDDMYNNVLREQLHVLGLYTFYSKYALLLEYMSQILNLFLFFVSLKHFCQYLVLHNLLFVTLYVFVKYYVSVFLTNYSTPCFQCSFVSKMLFLLLPRTLEVKHFLLLLSIHAVIQSTSEDDKELNTHYYLGQCIHLANM